MEVVILQRCHPNPKLMFVLQFEEKKEKFFKNIQHLVRKKTRLLLPDTCLGVGLEGVCVLENVRSNPIVSSRNAGY
jgi:hypothetical protein